MCGLAGFLGGRLSGDERRATVVAMTDRIAHRGPDDTGQFFDDRDGLALGFRRLSIVDLSPAGHQPMVSASGRYVLAFNGEGYTFESIRRDLIDTGNAPAFRGHSDTEVMLAAIEAWGVESAVRRFVGMFAIALWDREERTLFLIRDRVGVKPFYYGSTNGTFFFASELKALHAHPEFEPEIDRDALALYFRYTNVPAPFTIYRGIRKVMPGTIVAVNARGETREITYWSAAAVAEHGATHRFAGSEDEAADRLDALLRDAVGLRMIADVPLGVFLSGGIDSSIVTAMMQAQSSAPVKTFSIGFAEEDFNEAVHAARVAKHLGTQHTEMYVTASEALAVIPKLPSMYDEPFADSSQIPTHLVSALARRRRRRARARYPAHRPHALAAAERSDRADDVLRPDLVSARRHPHESRSREHGRQPRGSRAAPRSPAHRVRLVAAAAHESARRQRQVALAQSAVPLRARGAHRAAEDGLRRSGRRMDARPAARVGRVAARRASLTRRRIARRRPHPRHLARARQWPRRLAISPLDRADVPGVARRVARRRAVRAADSRRRLSRLNIT